MKETGSNTSILEDEKVWRPAGKGVVRQILGYDGQVMFIKIKLEQGAVSTLRIRYYTQTTCMANGKFKFTINSEKQIVSTDDDVYIEPDVEHGYTCLEANILVDYFNPMRTGFLKEAR